MGGSVAWTLRLPDGTEHRMQRWTNVFSGIDGVTSADAFLMGKPEAIQESLGSWLSMKADWEDNHETGKFRENMTSVYAPYPYGLRPSEYGFFVTDFQNHTIISCQTYTRLFRYHIYAQYMPPGEIKDGDTDVYGDPLHERYAVLQALHEAKRIVAYEDDHYEMKSTEGMSLPDIITAALKEHPNMNRRVKTLGYVGIKPVEPWRVLDFSAETKAGRRAAVKAVRALGFNMSKDEGTAFEKWIKGDYDDDA